MLGVRPIKINPCYFSFEINVKCDSALALIGGLACVRSIECGEGSIGVSHKCVKDILIVFELPRDHTQVIDANCDGALIEAGPQPRTGGIEGNKLAVRSAQEGVGYDVFVCVETHDCSLSIVGEGLRATSGLARGRAQK